MLQNRQHKKADVLSEVMATQTEAPFPEFLEHFYA